MSQSGPRGKAPRMSLVRRARTRIRRGDYSGELPAEVLEKIARGLLAELRREVR